MGVILNQQNELITDLFELDTPILLVAGEYNCGDQRNIHIIDKEEAFKLDSEEYDEVDIYRPAFAETIWKPDKHDKLLIEIAYDNTRNGCRNEKMDFNTK